MSDALGDEERAWEDALAQRAAELGVPEHEDG
jgi:hypothetical protein